MQFYCPTQKNPFKLRPNPHIKLSTAAQWQYVITKMFMKVFIFAGYSSRGHFRGE